MDVPGSRVCGPQNNLSFSPTSSPKWMGTLKMMADSQDAKFLLLWAKSQPCHPLWKHLVDASAVSLALPNPLEKWGWTNKQVALIVGLHDVGKADAGFQHQVAELSEGLKQAGFPTTCDARCRHERLSAKFIRCRLQAAGASERDADTIGRAVLAHHGYWDEGGVGAPYQEAQEYLCKLLTELLGLDDFRVPEIQGDGHSALGMRLAGHIVLCDWIASSEKYFQDSRLTATQDPEEYFAKSQEVAQEWIVKLQLSRSDGESNPISLVDRPRPIQKALLDNEIPPGLVIIEAPMGEGKTEAAWILAEKWREQGYTGIYMALPTMATSDSQHGRYRDAYLGRMNRGEEAHLIHGMAWLRDDNELEIPPNVGEPEDDKSSAAAWFRPTRRAMLAAHGVGTVDQAMLAAMHVKFGFLRLFGLADRVLVIDEVHAYDAYMSAIICRLLQWCACLKIPVVLLSATLSAKQRAAMIEAYGATGGDPGLKAPYPLITIAQPGQSATAIEADASSTRILKVQTHLGLLGDAKKTAKKAKSLVENGGCCCVILNTVKQAQAVYAELGNDVPSEQKLLFHARFTAADRQRIAEQVLDLFGKGRWFAEGDERQFKPAKRPKKFILVATQVVEQSLDVDFDHMISEIAPMDLLLQRSGRLHRHREREENPVLHVALPKEEDGKLSKFGPSELIYQRYPLLTTLAQLAETNGNHYVSVQLPNDFRKLIEATYSDDLADGASQDLQDAKAKWDDLQEDLAAQAGEFLLCEPMVDEFDPVGHDEVGDDSDDGNGWRARTRLGLEDVLVIPLRLEQLKEWKGGDLHPRLVKWLYKRSIKIPPYHWPPRESTGYEKAVLGKKKLKGVWLLPVKKEGDGWKWQGKQENKGTYTIKYDPSLGLTSENDKKGENTQ